MTHEAKLQGKLGAKVPCCAACQRAAHPAGFANRPAADEEYGAGLDEEGNPGTKDKPCSPCSL